MAGHNDRRKRERREQAWGLMYQLAAAGCKDVTIAKLLGEEEEEEEKAPSKELSIDSIFQAMTKASEAEVEG